MVQTARKVQTLMTLLLAHTDSYLREFDGVVTRVDKKACALILDRTAFYAGGGGQPCDVGTIHWMDGNTRHEVEIIKAKKGGADVSHYLVPTQTGSDDTISSGIRDSGTVRSPPLIALPAVGTTITGVINWARRYQLMRTHTAMHILCGVVWRDYGAQVTGGNMAPLNGRMDFEFENLKRELVDEIEEKINTEVLAAREVHVAIWPRTDAEQIPGLIRTKINLVPSSITEIRTVEIVGLDLQADGGTHVANTREVGRLRVIDYKSKGRINKRIRIALEDS